MTLQPLERGLSRIIRQSRRRPRNQTCSQAIRHLPSDERYENPRVEHQEGGRNTYCDRRWNNTSDGSGLGLEATKIRKIPGVKECF